MENFTFCFICNRATEHVAEHDDLVDAGLAVYTQDGCVHPTERYTEEAAQMVANLGTEAYYQSMNV